MKPDLDQEKYVCEICGLSGTQSDHVACEELANAGAAVLEASEPWMLRKYARFKCYGAHSKESEQSLAVAIGQLARYFGGTPEFHIERSIEGDKWWYIDLGWVGLIGCLVEKDSGRIFSFGSGLFTTIPTKPPRPIYMHWQCIEMYLAGDAPLATGEEFFAGFFARSDKADRLQ